MSDRGLEAGRESRGREGGSEESGGRSEGRDRKARDGEAGASTFTKLVSIWVFQLRLIDPGKEFWEPTSNIITLYRIAILKHSPASGDLEN